MDVRGRWSPRARAEAALPTRARSGLQTKPGSEASQLASRVRAVLDTDRTPALVAFVEGPPGIGKFHLLRRLRRRVHPFLITSFSAASARSSPARATRGSYPRRCSKPATEVHSPSTSSASVHFSFARPVAATASSAATSLLPDLAPLAPAPGRRRERVNPSASHGVFDRFPMR
jgi:hypothetical protein